MKPMNSVTGVAVPLRRSNVDTDQIIPAVYLKRITKTGFDDALFASWRTDPDFVLNQPSYLHPAILVAGPDFGTGSSREHAVWALKDYGFRVVLASRFGDIFRGNAGKQGLLVGTVDQSDIEKIWQALEKEPGVELTVSLHEKSITGPGLRLAFDIDEYTRWRLLEGLDDIAMTLRHDDEIAAFEQTREVWRPTTLPVRS